MRRLSHEHDSDISCDNVAVDISTGHKVALCDIKAGEKGDKVRFPDRDSV